MKCDKCGKVCSSQGPDGCHHCRIGNKDPVLWLIETITNKAENMKMGSTFEAINITRDNRYSIEEEHVGVGIIVNTRGSTIKCWDPDGQAYPDIKLGNIFDADLEQELRRSILLIWNYYDEGLILCSTCGKAIAKENVAGRHFAGGYCQDCWEAYKERNSRVCTLCRSPQYLCCC